MGAILAMTMNPSVDVSASTIGVLPVRKLRCTGVRRDPGGGGVNVARVVRRLNGECQALYPAGGSSGHLLRRLLDQEGILSLVVEIAAETRQNFTVLDETKGEQYRFVLPGAALTDKEWRACLDQLVSLPEMPAYIVASGSLPPGVPDDFYARIASTARTLGARLVLDTAGRPLAAALEAGVHLAKPNLRELRDLTGRPLMEEREWENAAIDLVCSGKADVVALTLGEEGALLVSRNLRLRAPGLTVRIVSAVGAGDSFLGAMVWRLSSNADLEEAFRYGLAAGTAALLTSGTELCRKEDVERLYHQVQVRHI